MLLERASRGRGGVGGRASAGGGTRARVSAADERMRGKRGRAWSAHARGKREVRPTRGRARGRRRPRNASRAENAKGLCFGVAIPLGTLPTSACRVIGARNGARGSGPPPHALEMAWRGEKRRGWGLKRVDPPSEYHASTGYLFTNTFLDIRAKKKNRWPSRADRGPSLASHLVCSAARTTRSTRHLRPPPSHAPNLPSRLPSVQGLPAP